MGCKACRLTAKPHSERPNHEKTPRPQDTPSSTATGQAHHPARRPAGVETRHTARREIKSRRSRRPGQAFRQREKTTGTDLQPQLQTCHPQPALLEQRPPDRQRQRLLQRLVAHPRRRGNAHLGTAHSEPSVSHARSCIRSSRGHPQTLSLRRKCGKATFGPPEGPNTQHRLSQRACAADETGIITNTAKAVRCALARPRSDPWTQPDVASDAIT